MLRPRFLSLCIPLLLIGCDRPADPIEPVAQTPPPAPSAPLMPPAIPPTSAALDPVVAPSPAARAVLQPTQGSTASGDLALAAQEGTLHVSGRMIGLTPNAEHGFHIHEHGDCSAPDAVGAGEHFNPSGAPHGPAAGPHHDGDLPNLNADAQGQAEVNLVLHDLELGTGGPHDVLGRAFIVHERRDDYSTQPSGDSGARIACGVIQRDAAAPAAPATGPDDDPPPPPADDS